MLRIYLTGRVAIETPTGVTESSVFPGNQGRLTFAYLSLVGTRVGREQLAHILWSGNPPDAWETSLNAVVSKLRRVLADAGLDAAQMLPSVSGCYELRLPPGTWIDLRAAINALDDAEAALARGEQKRAWAGASVASAVLRRPFLPGDDAAWVVRQRRIITDLRIRACDTLAGAWMLVGDHRLAVGAAREAVDLAPLRESAYARLIDCHLAAGDRADAIGAYLELQDRLRETLGISPSPALSERYLATLE